MMQAGNMSGLRKSLLVRRPELIEEEHPSPIWGRGAWTKHESEQF
jgi:hypothetical protein